MGQMASFHVVGKIEIWKNGNARMEVEHSAFQVQSLRAWWGMLTLSHPFIQC